MKNKNFRDILKDILFSIADLVFCNLNADYVKPIYSYVLVQNRLSNDNNKMKFDTANLQYKFIMNVLKKASHLRIIHPLIPKQADLSFYCFKIVI